MSSTMERFSSGERTFVGFLIWFALLGGVLTGLMVLAVVALS